MSRGTRTPPRGETPTADILPYVVPMFAYVTLGGLEGYLPQLDNHPSPTWYPIAYALRVVIVAATGLVVPLDLEGPTAVP